LVETISNSLVQTPSIDLPTEVFPPFDICNFVAIGGLSMKITFKTTRLDVDLPDEEHQVKDLDFQESVVVSQTTEVKGIKSKTLTSGLQETVLAEIIIPEEVQRPAPIVILQDTDDKKNDGEDEPKKFLEKKAKYGRDPKKLYETYQEEWARMEDVGKKRLGSRRKSVLASDKDDSTSASSSRAPSPARSTKVDSPQSKARLSTPTLRPDRPRSSAPNSPKQIRIPSQGAVKAAKEALERRVSQELTNPPLRGHRFM
jgi:hypothetical protein